MPAIRGPKSKHKTRRKTRDLDQIFADRLSPRHLQQYMDTKAVEDLPGLGKHYCVDCAKWFDGEVNLEKHQRGKPHKRQVKMLEEEPYTQKEAELAIGLRTDNGRLEEHEMDVDQDAYAAAANALVMPSQLSTGNVNANDDNDDSAEYNAFFTALKS